MIRRATLKDVPAIVALTKHFFSRLQNKDVIFDEETFISYATAFVNGNELSIALVSEAEEQLAAFIFCGLLPSPLTGELCATKFLWEAREDRPGHGFIVHRAAEKWARESGAKRFISSCFDKRAARLLERCGFMQIENVFEKVLT